jgi:hypothetical protein
MQGTDEGGAAVWPLARWRRGVGRRARPMGNGGGGQRRAECDGGVDLRRSRGQVAWRKRAEVGLLHGLGGEDPCVDDVLGGGDPMERRVLAVWIRGGDDRWRVLGDLLRLGLDRTLGVETP